MIRFPDLKGCKCSVKTGEYPQAHLVGEKLLAGLSIEKRKPSEC
jgi:hypothetical protein